MKQQKAGYIFSIASRAGKIGYVDIGVYSASKFGLVGLSESLYKKLAPFGIKVITICPGLVDTQMASETATKLSSEEMIRPIDIMETIRWLLKLSMSTFMKKVVIECKRQILEI
jgi:short-subunit dehydrogenase